MARQLSIFFSSLMSEQGALNKNENQIQRIEMFLREAHMMRCQNVITWSTLHKIKHQCKIELGRLYVERTQLKAAYTKKYNEAWKARNELAKKRVELAEQAKDKIEELRRKLGSEDFNFLINNKNLLK